MNLWVQEIIQTIIFQDYGGSKKPRDDFSRVLAKNGKNANPITKALPKLLVFSFKKYMQAAKETATCQQ